VLVDLGGDDWVETHVTAHRLVGAASDGGSAGGGGGGKEGGAGQTTGLWPGVELAHRTGNPEADPPLCVPLTRLRPAFGGFADGHAYPTGHAHGTSFISSNSSVSSLPAAGRPQPPCQQQLCPPPSSSSSSVAIPTGRAGARARGRLLQELRRGPQCAERAIRSLIEERADLLCGSSPDSTEDILSVALQSRCSAHIVELLILSHAPVLTRTTITSSKWTAMCAAEQKDNVEAPPWDTGPEPGGGPDPGRGLGGAGNAEVSEHDVALYAALALEEPRIAALLAHRGGPYALAAAKSMSRLAATAEEEAALAVQQRKSTSTTDCAEAVPEPHSPSSAVETPAEAQPQEEATAVTGCGARGGSSADELEEPEEARRALVAGATAALASATAAAAERLAVPRPRGSLRAQVRQFGQELLAPLLERGDGGEVGPLPLLEEPGGGGRLGGLLGALLVAGFEAAPAQVDRLAAAIAERLVGEPGPVLQSALAFVDALLDTVTSDGRGRTSLQALTAAFHRHGVVARLITIAIPGTLAGPLSGPVSGVRPRLNVSLDALREIAQRLAARLPTVEPVRDAERAVVDIVAKLPDLGALHSLIEMLRSGRCTPYELALHGAPARILPMLEPNGEEWPWSCVASPSLDLAVMNVLAPALQSVLTLCEVFPVAAADGQSGGLDSLVRPLELVLEGCNESRTLFVEPLLQLKDLERFVLQTTVVDDLEYLKWCEGLVGRRIAERKLGGGGPWQVALVVDFCVQSRLPVHTVRHEDMDKKLDDAKLLLHLREVVVLARDRVAATSSDSCADTANVVHPVVPSRAGEVDKHLAGSIVAAAIAAVTNTAATASQVVGQAEGTIPLGTEDGRSASAVVGAPVTSEGSEVRLERELAVAHAGGVEGTVREDGAVIAVREEVGGSVAVPTLGGPTATVDSLPPLPAADMDKVFAKDAEVAAVHIDGQSEAGRSDEVGTATMPGTALVAPVAAEGGGASAGESAQPHESVHKIVVNMPMVMAGEVPFEMVWEDMLEGGKAVMDVSSGSNYTSLGWKDRGELETTLRTGLEGHGCGPIARGLTREEAEAVQERLTHLADALAVVVDRQDVPPRRRARVSRPKPSARPPRRPSSGAVCRQVQVGRGGDAVVGVAVWEHESGALDVVDQVGRFHASVPAAQIMPAVRRARHAPGRAMPLELSVLGLSAASSSSPSGSDAKGFEWQFQGDAGWQTYEPPASRLLEAARERGEDTATVRSGSHRYLIDLRAGTQMNMTHPGRRVRPIQRIPRRGDPSLSGGQQRPQLERCFSAIDRNPVHDFQHKVLERKLEGDQLWRMDKNDVPRSSLEEEVDCGEPAPRLRALFFRAPPHNESPLSNEVQKPLPSTSTVLQALLPEPVPSRRAEQRLRCAVVKDVVDRGPREGRSVGVADDEECCGTSEQPWQKGITTTVPIKVEGAGVSAGELALTLALLWRLWRRQLLAARAMPRQRRDGEGEEEGSLGEGEGLGEASICWENAALNRKLAHQLAQPLLAAGGGALPPWVEALPLAYPFLFQRRLREQLLHCIGFGTSHGVLWLQRQLVEARFGERLRVARECQARTGNDAALWELHEQAASDDTVFVGAGRSELARLPGRTGLLEMASSVVELTYRSKAMLEVVFADETGFGDGVTQSFYTDVAAELVAMDNAEGPCLSLWVKHSPSSFAEYRGRRYLHSRRGLFPQAHFPGGAASKAACGHFRFLGRLMAKALRDGFVVPLPLCDHFFEAVLGQDLTLDALPQPGDGWAGEFVGAAAAFALELRGLCAACAGGAEERTRLRREEAERPGWAARWLRSTGAAGDTSFAQYSEHCAFLEMGVAGAELCDGGADRALDVECLEEFVECAAHWLLREGVAPQVQAFRQGVEDVCTSPAIWAFEASELRALLCGDRVKWTAEDLATHLRPRGGYATSSASVQMLIEELVRMAPDRRGQFLEFVTASPRLPPGGLAGAELVVVPASPKGSLPRAHTCTNELQLPAYDSREELSVRLAEAMDWALGMYE